VGALNTSASSDDRPARPRAPKEARQEVDDGMLRWLWLLTVTAFLATTATGAGAASASLICEPAPGVRFVGQAGGYRTRAEAEAIVRARCREAALRFHARSAEASRPPQRRLSNPSPRPAPIRDLACRRYPNLC
jgi:hypothetical protein